VEKVRKSAEKVLKKCGKSAEKVWKKCGKSAEKVRKKCGKSAEKVWKKCGKSVFFCEILQNFANLFLVGCLRGFRFFGFSFGYFS